MSGSKRHIAYFMRSALDLVCHDARLLTELSRRDNFGGLPSYSRANARYPKRPNFFRQNEACPAIVSVLSFHFMRDTPTVRPEVEAFWGEMTAGDHYVQFYESDAAFMDALEAFAVVAFAEVRQSS